MFTDIVCITDNGYGSSDIKGSSYYNFYNVCSCYRTNLLTSVVGWNRWFNRLTIGEQRSGMMSLSSDTNYLLIGHLKQGGGGSHMQVSYQMYGVEYKR